MACFDCYNPGKRRWQINRKGNGGTCEKWLDSGCILKSKLIGFVSHIFPPTLVYRMNGRGIPSCSVLIHLITHLKISHFKVNKCVDSLPKSPWFPNHRLNGRLLAAQKTQKILWTPHAIAMSLVIISFLGGKETHARL